MLVKKAYFITIISVVSLIAFSSCVFACSTFVLKKGEAFIVGHNDDEFTEYWPGYFFVNKRGVLKNSFSYNNLLGRPDTTPKIQWTSQYGSITWNALGREFPMGGINEAGLHIDVMSLHDTKYPENSSLPHMFVYQWVQYQLDNYQSVTEVVQNVSQIIPETEKWHFFISDRQGQWGCIEFINGQPRVYFGDSMPIPVLCNTPYEVELLCLKDFQGFSGSREVFVQNESFDTRFVQAATMIKGYDPDQSESPVQYGFRILKLLERGSNKWSIIVDVNDSRVYFHTSRSRKVKFFDYEEFDFSTDTPVMMFDLNSDSIGDVTKRFKPFSSRTNSKLVVETYKLIDKKLNNELNPFYRLNGTTLRDVTRRLAQFPETTSPNLVEGRLDMLSVIFMGLTLIAAALFIREEYRGQSRKNVFLKLLAGLGFLGIGIINLIERGNMDYGWFLLVGLGLGMVGDVLLAYQMVSTKHSVKFFLGGLFSFLLGHVAYILAFLSIAQIPGWTVLIVIAMAVGVYLLIQQMGCRLGRMKLPVLAYIAVISTMIVSSLFVASGVDIFGAMIVSGAVLFFISDYILCLLLFGENKKPWYRLINLSSYYVAQIILAFSILAAR